MGSHGRAEPSREGEEDGPSDRWPLDFCVLFTSVIMYVDINGFVRPALSPRLESCLVNASAHAYIEARRLLR
jgi:hypothetical protein